MKDKKRFIYFLILALLSAVLVLTTIFVPLTHIIAGSSGAVVDKTYSLYTFLKEAPFLQTVAGDVYFTNNGPTWLAGFGILLNCLVAVLGAVAFVGSVFELATTNRNKINCKQNNFAKKLVLFAGYFGMFVALYQIAAFITTTTMSYGKAMFGLNIQIFVTLVVSVAIVVLGHISGKTQYNQTNSKVRNAVGFGLTALFVALSYAFVFIPQYSKYFLDLQEKSFWQIGSNANTYVGATYAGGDYPLGISFYVIAVLGLVSLVAFIFCLIGFIRALRGKSTNFLSARAKNWSIVFLAVYLLLYMFEFAIIANFYSTLKIDNISLVLPVFYFALFLPFVPVATSHIIFKEQRHKK